LVRFRLRFLLQEVELPPGETLLGRSSTCQLSLEDPLVSRQHARITVQGTRVTIEDLSSRNGVQVGGRNITGVHELADGDRIRIGTQEFVFCRLEPPDRSSRSSATRSTGFLCHCADCGIPFARELRECPNCGSTERSDDQTVSGGDKSNWSLQLLAEVLQKALDLGRFEDAHRVLERAQANVENQVTTGQRVDHKSLEAVATAAAAVAVARGDGGWGRWLLALYAALGLAPPEAVVERLTHLPTVQRRNLAEQAARIVEALRSQKKASHELERAMSLLDSLGG
jgi:hypothetical protein